jgi:hypothetical protein
MPEPPGELVGAYQIEGALTENTCGSRALPAIDPLSFAVEIREQDRQGLWLRDTPPARPGRLDEDGSFEFTFESRYPVTTTTESRLESLIEADAEKLADPAAYEDLDSMQSTPCLLLVDERVSGRLLRDSRPAQDGDPEGARDAGADEEDDLVGENSIDIRAAGGTDCDLVLEAQGGPFLELPCRAHYQLSGELL